MYIHTDTGAVECYKSNTLYNRPLLHARDHSVPEGLDYVAVWNAAMLQSRDIPGAMQAALSKKKQTYARL